MIKLYAISRRKTLKLFGASPFIFGRTTFVPDRYTLLEYYPAGTNLGPTGLNAGFSNPIGKTRRDGALVAAQSTAVLVVFGQSNACNVNPTAYVPTNASVCDNFSIYDGGVYAATDPLLGCSTSTLGPGNPFLRLADTLITNSVFQRVILVPGAIGATTMAMWGSDQFNRISVTFARLSAAGLTATGVLYQQGETDNSNGTSQATYAAGLVSFIAACRAAGYNGPIFVAKSSLANNTTSSNVTNAQVAAVTNVANGIWSLGNMDSLTGGTNRQADGTHLTDVGAASWAALMYMALTAYGPPF